jgi:hypothetical protein
MAGARAAWTDERLDDPSNSVDRVDQDLRQLRSEMNGRFDALHRLIVQASGGLMIAVVATLLSVVVTRA